MNEHYDHFSGYLGGVITTVFAGISVNAVEIGYKLLTCGIALLVGGTTVWYNLEKIKDLKRNKNKPQ